MQFGPQNLDIWEKSNFFVLESRFLSIGHINSTLRATTFNFGGGRGVNAHGQPDRFFMSSLTIVLNSSGVQCYSFLFEPY